VQSVEKVAFTRDYFRHNGIFHTVFHRAVENAPEDWNQSCRSADSVYLRLLVTKKPVHAHKLLPEMYYVRSSSSVLRMLNASNPKAPAEQEQEKDQGNSAQRRKQLSDASPMNAERLKKLYAAMLKCRLSQEQIRKHLPSHLLCTGLEAMIAGAAIHLKKEDLVAPNAEGDFAQLVQGKTLAEVIDCCKQDVDELQSGTSVAELSIAAGMAFACKQLGKSLITLCVARADHDPDSWRDAVSFCSRRKIPIVFVIAQHSDPEQSNLNLRTQAQKYLPAITVDGNDVVAVYRVAEESTRRARQEWGPSFIECKLQTGKDPLAFMEGYLRQRNLWSDAWREELERDLRRGIQMSRKKPARS